jgi:hypothetical protein
MSSQLKSETARINGAKSQGPTTPEGRARSSQNALSHGLSSVNVVIAGENPAEFAALRASYIERFQPTGYVESELADTMAAARWRLRRINRIETTLLDREQSEIEKAIAAGSAEGGDFDSHLASAFDRMANTQKTPALLIRYERHLTRIYEISRKELQILQKSRATRASAGEPRKVQNEPKPEPIQAPSPRLMRQNERQSAAPSAPALDIAPILPRETTMAGAPIA